MLRDDHKPRGLDSIVIRGVEEGIETLEITNEDIEILFIVQLLECER